MLEFVIIMSRDNIQLRIKDILRQNGMTSKGLAEKLGKSPAYINNVINGRGMSLNILADISVALGVEFGDLFTSSHDNLSNKDFSAVVQCYRGSFTCTSQRGLQSLLEVISADGKTPIHLMKRTLERLLRFPANQNNSIISELLCNLWQCMLQSDWETYRQTTLNKLLPRDFALDVKHLNGFITKADIAAFQRALGY